jgi:hypothetical protein
LISKSDHPANATKQDEAPMRPWQHAKSSAHEFDSCWQRDLPVHEFLDITKTAVADLRHRIVLHNTDLGPRLAAMAFPDIPNVWNIAQRHVREDMGCEPSLADWLSCCDISRLPTPKQRSSRRNDIVDMLTEHLGLGSPVGPAAVVDILLLPMELAPDVGKAALAVLCNSVGPFIVRQVLGGPRDETALSFGTKVFDPAWTAEAAIVWLMGRRIPTLAEVVDAVGRLPQ